MKRKNLARASAAALAVIMMILTTLMILLYRKVTNAKEVEGLG